MTKHEIKTVQHMQVIPFSALDIPYMVIPVTLHHTNPQKKSGESGKYSIWARCTKAAYKNHQKFFAKIL